MLKVVIDTSVFVSALLSKSQVSSPYLVLQAWQQGKFTLVMAPQLLQELVLKLLQLGVPEATKYYHGTQILTPRLFLDAIAIAKLRN